MRKHLMFAGILIAAALVFAVPSKADTVVFTLTGSAMPGGASFSLPDTFTPTAGTGPFIVANVQGTLLGNPFNYPFIEIGIRATNEWAFGSNGVPNFPGTSDCIALGNCPYLGIFAPNLFTVNADGSITLNELLGTLTVINNQNAQLTLTETVIPSPVGTPEPATLALLGIGGLALAGFRRRKA
jgi:PEP-CTERM motif